MQERTLGTNLHVATKLHRLEENIGAANLTLTPDDLDQVNDAASPIDLHGHRYGEGSERMVDR